MTARRPPPMHVASPRLQFVHQTQGKGCRKRGGMRLTPNQSNRQFLHNKWVRTDSEAGVASRHYMGTLLVLRWYSEAAAQYNAGITLATSTSGPRPCQGEVAAQPSADVAPESQPTGGGRTPHQK